MHSNFFVKAGKNRFVLRIFEHARSEEQAVLEVKILEKNKKGGLPVPAIIRLRNGKCFSEFEGKRAALFSFLKGAHVNIGKASPEQIRSVGLMMGKMHRVMRGFRAKEMFSKEKYDKSYALRFLARVKKENPELPGEIERYVVRNLEAIKQPELPQGIVHADMYGDNVLFKNNKVSGVLDFDDCFYGDLLTDIACGIMFWCIGNKIYYGKCRNFLDAYSNERKLTKIEKQSLFYQIRLFAVIHMLFLLLDRKNWNKKTKPVKTLELLDEAGREGFYEKLFENF
jgi:homoserine kinase type II